MSRAGLGQTGLTCIGCDLNGKKKRRRERIANWKKEKEKEKGSISPILQLRRSRCGCDAPTTAHSSDRRRSCSFIFSRDQADPLSSLEISLTSSPKVVTPSSIHSYYSCVILLLALVAACIFSSNLSNFISY